MGVPWMSAILWISGFILLVVVVLDKYSNRFIFGHLFTQIILRRILSGEGAGVDVLVSMSIAIVALIVGVLAR